MAEQLHTDTKPSASSSLINTNGLQGPVTLLTFETYE